jgi:hypothetical protein
MVWKAALGNNSTKLVRYLQYSICPVSTSRSILLLWQKYLRYGWLGIWSGIKYFLSQYRGSKAYVCKGISKADSNLLKHGNEYYCVLPGNATNNLWALDLIMIYLLEYSPGGTTISHLTILQHVNFTFDSSVRRLLHSPLNWLTDASLSTDLTLHMWTLNWHPIWIWTYLELNCPGYYQSHVI